MKSFSQQAGIQGGLGAAFPSHATFPHYAIPQGLPPMSMGTLPILQTTAIQQTSTISMEGPSTHFMEEEQLAW